MADITKPKAPAPAPSPEIDFDNLFSDDELKSVKLPDTKSGVKDFNKRMAEKAGVKSVPGLRPHWSTSLTADELETGLQLMLAERGNMDKPYAEKLLSKEEYDRRKKSSSNKGEAPEWDYKGTSIDDDMRKHFGIASPYANKEDSEQFRDILRQKTRFYDPSEQWERSTHSGKEFFAEGTERGNAIREAIFGYLDSRNLPTDEANIERYLNDFISAKNRWIRPNSEYPDLEDSIDSALNMWSNHLGIPRTEMLKRMKLPLENENNLQWVLSSLKDVARDYSEDNRDLGISSSTALRHLQNYLYPKSEKHLLKNEEDYNEILKYYNREFDDYDSKKKDASENYGKPGTTYTPYKSYADEDAEYEREHPED